MVTDSESLFLDNGLIRKHLLEFLARHVTATQGAATQDRDQAVAYKSIRTEKRIALARDLHFFQTTGFVDGFPCPSASPRILLLFYPARNLPETCPISDFY